MCEVFISADPQSYESRTRSVRLHGVVTSIRLENLFWQVLEEIARPDARFFRRRARSHHLNQDAVFNVF